MAVGADIEEGMDIAVHVADQERLPEQIQGAVRIAATVHAVARTLAAEEALTPRLAQAA